MIVHRSNTFDCTLPTFMTVVPSTRKVKVLVYSLALAVAAIHTTLQASHYLPVRELH